ncbi:hypothetical protein HDV01_007123 [Terramyces sp. JEL0728]|nr:hypothetical protein HDV01_007123 [Terramyces sp. JEL0728]
MRKFTLLGHYTAWRRYSTLEAMQLRLQNENENLRKFVDDVVLGVDTRRLQKKDAFDLLFPLLSKQAVPSNLYTSMLYLDKQKSLETKNEELYLHYIDKNNYIEPFSYNTFNHLLLKAIQNQDKAKVTELLRIKKWRIDVELFKHLEAMFDCGYKGHELVCYLLMESHVDDAFEYFVKISRKTDDSAKRSKIRESELQPPAFQNTDTPAADKLGIKDGDLIMNQNLLARMLYLLSRQYKQKQALTVIREILPQIRYPKALMIPLRQTGLSIIPDLSLQKNIVYSLEKAKLKKLSDSLGYSFPKQSIVQYNYALVDALKTNNHGKANQVLDELLHSNIKIDLKMYCTILSFGLQYGSLEDGKSVYQHILLNGIKPDVTFFNVWLEREIIDSIGMNTPAVGDTQPRDSRELKKNVKSLSSNELQLLQKKVEYIVQLINNYTKPNSKTYSLLLYTGQENLVVNPNDYDYYTNVIPALLDLDYYKAKQEFTNGLSEKLNRKVTNSMLMNAPNINETSFILYTLYKNKYTFPKPLLAKILQQLIDHKIYWCIVLIPQLDYWRDGNRLFSKVVYQVPKVDFYQTGHDPKEYLDKLVDIVYHNKSDTIPLEMGLPYLVHLVRDSCKAHHKNNFPNLPPAKKIVFKRETPQPLPPPEHLIMVNQEPVKTVTTVFGDIFKDVDELVFGIGDGTVWWDDLKKQHKRLLKEVQSQEWSKGHLSRPYCNKMVDSIVGFDKEKEWFKAEEKIVEYIQLAKRV